MEDACHVEGSSGRDIGRMDPNVLVAWIRDGCASMLSESREASRQSLCGEILG